MSWGFWKSAFVQLIIPMEVALRNGDERIWVKKFWSKLFCHLRIIWIFDSNVLHKEWWCYNGGKWKKFIFNLKENTQSSSKKESIQRRARQNPKVLVCYGILNKITLYRALDVFQNDSLIKFFFFFNKKFIKTLKDFNPFFPC